MRADLCVQTAVAVSVPCGNKDCSVCKVSINVQAKAKPLTSVSVLLIKNGLDSRSTYSTSSVMSSAPHLSAYNHRRSGQPHTRRSKKENTQHNVFRSRLCSTHCEQRCWQAIMSSETHLLPHLVHKIWTGDSFRKAREVLHLCSGHELATTHTARLISFKYERPHVCSCSIYCRCVASWTTANNDQVLDLFSYFKGSWSTHGRSHRHRSLF